MRSVSHSLFGPSGVRRLTVPNIRQKIPNNKHKAPEPQDTRVLDQQIGKLAQGKRWECALDTTNNAPPSSCPHCDCDKSLWCQKNLSVINDLELEKNKKLVVQNHNAAFYITASSHTKR